MHRFKVFLLIFILFGLTQKSFRVFLYKGIAPPAQRLAIRSKVEVLSELIKKHIKPGEKAYFISQNSSGYEKYIFNYLLVPNHSSPWYWSFGPKYYECDVWTSNTEFKEKIKGYSYLAIYNADSQFWDKNKLLFDAKSRNIPYGAFKIIWNGTKVTIEKIDF